MGAEPGFSIAVAGKGGTGKTTISGSLISYLCSHHSAPILAVDADPSTNLASILGVAGAESLGDIREETMQDMINFPPGMTKARYLEYRIHQAVQEYDRFDLLTMGRPEGPGCYCYVNRLLRTALDTLSQNYAFIVMDCEAGMEHVSRRTSREIDHLVVISDPSVRGLDVALRISLMADSLHNKIGCKHLLLNRCLSEQAEILGTRIEHIMTTGGFHSQTVIPESPELAPLDLEGKSIFDLPREIEFFAALELFLLRKVLS
ncbi:AAA family ATPase [candidate division CSSED10-310 bacterium]|uniref:AAA family ATPase n=1 Tax=candidate division CSSED10-310 bacterium TaxID=2855610 RepID=A0ABV6Z454_UNCC1